MISNIVKTMTAKSKTAIASSTYGAACKNACTTPDGAYALESKLEELAQASQAGGERRRLYLKQRDAAGAVAVYLRTRAELEIRIPQALDRNQQAASDAHKAAIANMKAADENYESLKKKLASARQRLDGFEVSRNNATQSVQAQLNAARDGLQTAQKTQDFDAIERYGNELGDAERSLKAAEEGSLGLRMKIEAVQVVIAGLDAELQTHREHSVQATAAKQKAELQEACVKSDRLMLAALIAMADVVAISGEETWLPKSADGCAFFFMPEHFPFWKDGRNDVMVTVDLLRNLAACMKEPDWSVFDTDPATLEEQAKSPEPPDLTLDSLNAEINRRNVELVNVLRSSGASGVRITTEPSGA